MNTETTARCGYPRKLTLGAFPHPAPGETSWICPFCWLDEPEDTNGETD